MVWPPAGPSSGPLCCVNPHVFIVVPHLRPLIVIRNKSLEIRPPGAHVVQPSILSLTFLHTDYLMTFDIHNHVLEMLTKTSLYLV